MDNWKNSIKWEELLLEIKSGQCVLVIGPDLVEFNKGQTLFQVLCKQLRDHEQMKTLLDLPEPQYFFENEELLQLHDNARDSSLYKFYKQFYEQRTEFDIPFKKISRLPFHLIISLLPDSRLTKIFQQESIPCDFSYYPLGINNAPKVEIPSSEKPLIYNIMGVVDPPDMVITFDHLFLYLSRILGSRPLPIPILEVLQSAKSFMFLGVRFEKWYMQMLLRIFLSSNPNNEKLLKYSLLQNQDTTEISTFIARRLRLNFLEVSPVDFLDELYVQANAFEQLTNEEFLRHSKKKKVFISYSHVDGVQAIGLYELLEENGVEVILDQVSMAAGDRISHFMDNIKNVDVIVWIVSENSLKSPYVGNEICKAISFGKPIIPCHLDDIFLSHDLVSEAVEYANKKLRELNIKSYNRKNNTPLNGASDITREEDLWRSFGHQIEDNVNYLRNVKSIDLREEHYNRLLLNSIQAK
ncbi:hypothetical protein Dfri01_10220 [Dyadobacter frigoris]|uniref:toll/interleukin-1 receptor domain-containing protein n=1 Tax=Dyadobacter frigoris TaxID=2576211 RepID=UPI0024A46649|nr:toll/interleukin-1 receptor domain-containing protein [Dyadobacter frigoris]GLU51561.1 hypothetical protein Dfri01_10220 [Dyadobacter frigoris]